MTPADLRTARKALGMSIEEMIDVLRAEGYRVFRTKAGSIPFPDRFWGRVDKTGDCWLWLGGKDKKGYGMCKFSGRSQGAHRIAWQITNGTIADGLVVMHICDQPGCVNPGHLALGTNAENTADKVSKGRQARGLVCVGSSAKLSFDDVRAIRASKEQSMHLAKRYGCSEANVRAIRSGLSWGYLS